MFHSKKKVSRLLVCLLLALSFVMRVHADTTSEKIDDVKSQVQESQEKLQDTQQEIQNLENSKEQLQGTLGNLNNELGQLSNELSNLEKQLQNKKYEIEATQKELDKAKQQEQEQYESMKMRIKYMYEMKDDSFMELFMEGGNFADLLNKAEYIAKITKYDRDMLVQYQETKDAISQKNVALDQERKEMEQLKAKVGEKQQRVSLLVNQTASQIAQQQGDLDKAEQKALEYEKELQAQQDTLESLKEQEAMERAVREAEARAKKEAAAKAKAEAEGREYVPETPRVQGRFNIIVGNAGYEQAAQSSELDLLAAIIYCEAGGEPYEGKIAVGSVVMNRIRSVAFPNTMLEVLYQKSQFTPVTSGRFAIILARGGASAESVQAAKEVLAGANNVPDCLFFRTVIPQKQGRIIGNHVFY